MTTLELLERWLRPCLPDDAFTWFGHAATEIGGGVDDDRFCALLSMASRHTWRRPLTLSQADVEAARAHLTGWNPERWNRLEALRVALVLSRKDLGEDAGHRGIEEAFRYADDGEASALYRSLAHLPRGERFVWRAGEGCRSNMASVFQAVALDTPYPARHFDDVAWNQAVIKSLFIDVPLWRMHGLDDRLSPELARMALDLADERRSAGRPVPHHLWLCLGTHGGERGLAALELELEKGNRRARCAAGIGMARAGACERLRALVAQEPDEVVRATWEGALDGATQQGVFRQLEPVD
ncbi:MAG: EboA domain-containing protein [Planctomycetes bacterium]|nr:EboA domain-containing protein [Planctomycetota bacterium]